MFGSIKRVKENETEASKLYLLVYDLQQDIVQSMSLIVGECDKYVSNSMPPLVASQVEKLNVLVQKFESYLSLINEWMTKRNFEQLESINSAKKDLVAFIEGLN